MLYSFPADYRTSEEVEINDAFSNVLLDIFQDHGFRSSLFAVQAHGAAGFALKREGSTMSRPDSKNRHFGRSDAADFIGSIPTSVVPTFMVGRPTVSM